MGGSLQEERVSPSYLRRLQHSQALLIGWLGRRGVALAVLVEHVRPLNEALIEFVQALYDEGAALWVATHTILAVQHFHRHTRGHLKSAWDSIYSWKLKQPVRCRTPLPEELLDGICGVAYIFAMKLEPYRAGAWLCFLVCMKAGFYGMLRPAELCGLTKAHCRIVVKRGVATLAMLAIENPKNRGFMGRQQVAVLRDSSGAAWLEWLLVDWDTNQRVWRGSRHGFNAMLQQCLGYLGAEDLGLTPACLRAGGTTTFFERGTATGHLRYYGRWASERSMSCYIQEAESALTMLKLSLDTTRRLDSIAESLAFLARPPVTPWAVFAARGAQAQRRPKR